jgi:uncharacterized oligopeptide transporter (OPT) family protein
MPKYWHWDVGFSPGFIGNGMILGPKVTLDIFLGALLGWWGLQLLTTRMHWAPGGIDDWQNGLRGWILWPSLAALLADCLITLFQPLILPVPQTTGHARISSDGSAQSRQSQQYCSPTRADADLGDAESLTGYRDIRQDRIPLRISLVDYFFFGAMAIVVCLSLSKASIATDVSLHHIVLVILIALAIGYMAIQAEGATGSEPAPSLGMYLETKPPRTKSG